MVRIDLGRRGTAAALLITLLLSLLPAAQAGAEEPLFDISAQSMPTALQAFAAQAHVQLLFDYKALQNLKTSTVKGRMDPKDALSIILKGSGFTFQRINSRTIAIRPAPRVSTRAVPLTQNSEIKAAKKKSSSGGFPVAQGTRELIADDPSSSPVQLSEVIVTAQKRDERLIDTPQSVSVLSADDLSRLGALQFRDYANTIAGLNFTTIGAGYSDISMRGVTTGFDFSPTVGIYIDDVPYGSSTGFAQGAQTPIDIAPFDISRIEVLRGPQGTLYGASTMGGLIKYVTKRPSSTDFSVDLQSGLSGTEDGGVGYNGAIAVNAPLVADEAGLRASIYYTHDGGFVDNVGLADKDANRSDTYGGRADLLLTPTDRLSVRIAGLVQDISRSGEGTVDYSFSGTPLYGDLDQKRIVPEPFEQHFRLISATVNYDFGPAALTSISSYQRNRTDITEDISAVYVPLFADYFDRSYSSVGYATDLSTDKLTQEVRLASRRSQAIQWLVGGFFTHEVSGNDQNFFFRDLAGNPAPNDLYLFSSPTSYEESAAFGDLTWRLSRKFDVTAGMRYAHNSQEYTQYGMGLVESVPARASGDSVVTYLGNARYYINDRATAYLRYATGYRPGGPNFAVIDAKTGQPTGGATFKADTLRSYEAGIKVESSDHRYSIDLAGYHVDWSDIQITVIRGGFSAIANAPAGATVEGSELELAARPLPGLTAVGAFAYQHAYLNEADADLGNATGERLPNVPRATVSGSLDYELPVTNLHPSVGLTARYVGDRKASFNASTSFPQYDLPEYTSLDVRAGIVVNEVLLQLYAHNITDERGQLGLMLPQFGARVAILQPLTVGLSASVQF